MMNEGFVQPPAAQEAAPTPAPTASPAPATGGSISPEFLDAFKRLAEQFPEDTKALIEQIKGAPSEAPTEEMAEGEVETEEELPEGISPEMMDYSSPKGGAYIPESRLNELGTKSLKGFMPKK